jgi:hypothetical protein
LRDNPRPGDSAIAWSFNLNFDTLTRGKSIKGGNVTEMPNSNLLVCAGDLNRTFEVTRSKEVVWDAFIYFRKVNDTSWNNMAQYRASFIEKVPMYHFMSSVETTQLQNMPTILLKLYNTGNMMDNYEIKVLDQNGKVLNKLITKKTPENGELKETIIIKNFIPDTHPASVTITSLGSNGIVSKLLLNF